MKASEFVSRSADTAKSLVKILLHSHKSDISGSRRVKPLIILANGPSLRQTIERSLAVLKANDTMTVNFAPNTPEFFDIRPKFHVLADPLFFAENKSENVAMLYRNLSKVDWELTLLVPCGKKRNLPADVIDNPNVIVQCFNFIGADGFDWVERISFDLRRAMPRPRNVLVPALMCAIWLGYSKIYIAGADHSWMQTISVDTDNNVISVQPHFYKDDRREQQRVDTAYRNYRLHDIVGSFAIVFRSYHVLQRYALQKGVEIYNVTPGSFIDAFPRRELGSEL